MSAGYVAVKTNIDTRAGSLVVELRDKLDEIQNFKFWLDAITDGELTALGYDTTDVARLRGAFTDLAKLGNIYLGTQTQSSAYDFRTFAKFLTGVQ